MQGRSSGVSGPGDVDFFDDAQCIDQSCRQIFRGKDVETLVSEVQAFNWVRVAGIDHQSVEHLWDWISDSAIFFLTISWRCGKNVTAGARETSTKYGVPANAPYVPGRGIYCASELADYDGSFGAFIPQTMVRASIYWHSFFTLVTIMVD